MVLGYFMSDYIPEHYYDKNIDLIIKFINAIYCLLFFLPTTVYHFYFRLF